MPTPVTLVTRLTALTVAATAIVLFSSGPQVIANQAIDSEVLAKRELAWRAYFAGDTDTLGALLPPEFIGIGMTDEPFADRARTLTESRAFRDRGGRLVKLAFPETQAQRYGDTVVLYGRFELAIYSDGAEHTMRGRLTEVFVHRNGKWLHPGWHLDLVGGPGKP